MKWKRLSDLTENEQRESVKPGTDVREDPQKRCELEKKKQNIFTVNQSVWQIMTASDVTDWHTDQTRLQLYLHTHEERRGAHSIYYSNKD